MGGVAVSVVTNPEAHSSIVAIIYSGVSSMNTVENLFMTENRAVLRQSSTSSLTSATRFSRKDMRNHWRRATSLQRTIVPEYSNSKVSSSRDDYIQRFLSFYNDHPSNYGSSRGNSQQPTIMGSPAYTVYGEEIAFTLKAILPEYRTLPNGTIILDASKRGRLLFEWTPMAGGHDDNGGNKRYQWDASTRFALTAEEAGSLLARLDRGDPSVEFSRRISGNGSPTGRNVDKVFLAKTIELKSTTSDAAGENKSSATKNDGIALLVDYVNPECHRFGEIPHPLPAGSSGAFGNKGTVGPLEIHLMVGEYHVLRSIIQYSLPKLVGWSTMFDQNIEHAVAKSVENGGNQRVGGGKYGVSSPHNYQGSGSY